MNHSYQVLIHAEPKAFTQAVQSFLEAHEAENGLFLGVLALLKTDPPSTTVFMTEVRQGQDIVAAAIYRDRNLIVTQGPDEVWPEVASSLKGKAIDIPGVVGPAVQSERMAQEWAQVRRCKFRLAMDQRLYILAEVIWPEGIPGKAKLVEEHDVANLATYIEGFYRDAIPWEMPSKEQILENALGRIPAKMTYFWEVNGESKAMAALSRPSGRGITINAVYTPVEHRKRGYATALVAAISQEGLNRGKEFCVLYTDLTNPTSNSIYQKVGYTPVCDSRNYRFDYG